MSASNFGSRLKHLRTEKGWSQEKLSQQLGVFRTLITKYENGINMPSYDILIKISKVFDVSLEYLLGVSDGKNNLTLSELNKLKSEIHSAEPDLITIINETKPRIDGVPATEEQLKYLTLILKSMKEQLSNE